jgi:hypothetical protein
MSTTKYLKEDFQYDRVPSAGITTGVNQNYPSKEDTVHKYRRVHRLVLKASDRAEGGVLATSFNNVTFDVKLQPFKTDKLTLYVESFHMEDTTGDTTFFDVVPYNIHLKEMKQPLSYYSRSNGPSDIIATIKGVSYHHGNDYDFGYEIPNPNIFNGTITIYFSSKTSRSPDLVQDIDNYLVGDWILTLLIVEG